MPADILPTAVNTPVGIVYDADGSVTSALLGQGAGDAGSCFSNAAFGGVDNFSTDGHLLHALVVLNGNCAQTSDQIPDVKYRLVRVLGRALGLDWSQANVNVFTRTPAPTSGDFAGLTIMHALDPINCVPISLCFPNADQPKNGRSRRPFAPVSPDGPESGEFSGQAILSNNTARIHGSVYFVDSNAQPAQPMQGVNVVARWIDPATGQPSGASVATSVSGFLFCGNAGNPATGFTDSTGQRFDRFGSDDPGLEGFFDLAGLQIPNGTGSAQYQLTVEPVDPTWSQLVGPYGPWQVQPSGTAQPIIVTTSLGSDTAQDILMQNSASQEQDWFEPTSYSSPAPLPAGGNWGGSLSGSGNSDYFFFSGQSNRTLSVEVTALDESHAITESKAQPVIGMWGLADPGTFPAPASTPLAFNTLTFGMTRLDAILQAATTFRLGIFDYRGDGRPDYRYRARVFYADNVTPVRASTSSSLDISVPSPFAWIAQGATLDMPLTARVLSNGSPVSSSTVTFQVMKGSATLNPANPTTNANGYATTTLHVPALGGDLQVSACVQPGSKPCQSFSAVAVPASSLRLEVVSGGTRPLPWARTFNQ